MTLAWRSLSQRLGLGLLAFSALLVAPSLEDAFALPQRLGLTLSALLLALSAPPRLPVGRLGWALLTYLAWRILSRGIADPPGSVLAWAAEQAVLWGLLVFGAAAMTQAPLRRYSAAALVSAGALVCVVALLPWLGLPGFAAGSLDLGFRQRAFGSLGNPDFLGGWLALLLPLAIVVTGRTQGRLRALSVAAAILIAGTLGLSGARASWLAGALGVAVALAALKPAWLQRRQLIVAALAALLLLGLGVAKRQALPPRLAEALDLRSDAWQARAFMAGTALQVAVAHPWVGVGAGGFMDAYLQRQGERLSGGEAQPYRFTYDAHNDWLQVAAESGWLGLLLWALGWAWSLRVAWRHGGPEGAALAGALTAFAVQACFHFPWAIWPSAGVLLLGLGLAAALEAEASVALPGWGAWLCGAFLLAVLGFGLRQSASSALLNRGQSAVLQAATSAEAVPYFAKAGALRPDDSRAWLGLGTEQLRRGNLDHAIGAFQTAILAHPSQPETWVNLGLALGQQGSLDSAETVCAQGVALNPRSKEAWGNWSKVAWLRGDAKAAEERLRQGLKEAGPSAQASFNLGAILYNERRFKEAALAFEAVLQLQPEHAEAKRLLKESRHAH